MYCPCSRAASAAASLLSPFPSFSDAYEVTNAGPPPDPEPLGRGQQRRRNRVGRKVWLWGRIPTRRSYKLLWIIVKHSKQSFFFFSLCFFLYCCPNGQQRLSRSLAHRGARPVKPTHPKHTAVTVTTSRSLAPSASAAAPSTQTYCCGPDCGMFMLDTYEAGGMDTIPPPNIGFPCCPAAWAWACARASWLACLAAWTEARSA